MGSILSAAAILPAAAHEAAPADFLASLRATSVTPITHEDYVALAATLGVEAAALEAIALVETDGATGYDDNGRPRILFEPHIFSRRTNRRFDASHPTISYPSFDARRYPRTQDERWAQLTEAFALAPDDALCATSWGAFQLMGFHFPSAGYSDVQAFVTDLAHSPQKQLAAWVRWIQSNGLLDEIQSKDWAGFARRYNGPGYAANRYDERMAAEYARLTAAAN